MQLTIFADGEPVISNRCLSLGAQGKEYQTRKKRKREKRQYDPRVVVKFQDNV